MLSRQPKEDGDHQSAARLELSIGPRFPARPVCGQAKLAELLQNCRINWRRTIFPRSSFNLVSLHESLLVLTPNDIGNRTGLVETNIWGMLFYGVELDIEVGPRQTAGLHQIPMTGVHLYRLVGHLLVFLEHAKQMISLLGYEGPLSIDTALSGILGVPWLYSQDRTAVEKGPVSELDDAFSFCVPATTDEFKSHRDGLAITMLQYIFFGMNWADHASSLTALEEILRSGYEYNFWGNPNAPEV